MIRVDLKRLQPSFTSVFVNTDAYDIALRAARAYAATLDPTEWQVGPELISDLRANRVTPDEREWALLTDSDCYVCDDAGRDLHLLARIA